jgi:RNA polymerase sigma-70 factor (ECF subfamily)
MARDVRNKVVEENRGEATTRTVAPAPKKIVGLIRRAAGGDAEAFGELYSLYLDRIYRYVFYQVRDRMTAEDITEEVFIRAWRAIGSCQGKERTFSSWLYRIAHNRVIDTFRSQRKELLIDMETLAEFRHPKVEAETELEWQELLKGIDCLPRNQKQVIILKFIEGLDNREIGQVIGKNQGAIRILQMRALAKLREKLGSER